jgi:hypothetical protein
VGKGFNPTGLASRYPQQTPTNNRMGNQRERGGFRIVSIAKRRGGGPQNRPLATRELHTGSRPPKPAGSFPLLSRSRDLHAAARVQSPAPGVDRSRYMSLRQVLRFLSRLKCKRSICSDFVSPRTGTGKELELERGDTRCVQASGEAGRSSAGCWPE